MDAWHGIVVKNNINEYIRPKTLSERLIESKDFNIKSGELDPEFNQGWCTPEDFCITCEDDCLIYDNLNQTNGKSISNM